MSEFRDLLSVSRERMAARWTRGRLWMKFALLAGVLLVAIPAGLVMGLVALAQDSLAKFNRLFGGPGAD